MGLRSRRCRVSTQKFTETRDVRKMRVGRESSVEENPQPTLLETQILSFHEIVLTSGKCSEGWDQNGGSCRSIEKRVGRVMGARTHPLAESARRCDNNNDNVKDTYKGEIERRKQRIPKSGQSNKKLNHEDSGSESSDISPPHERRVTAIQVNE